MKNLLKQLRKSKKISDWKVNVETTESTELFYVQKKLETNRATSTVDYDVTIYVDMGDKRGKASFTYYPYMDEEEIKAEIDKAVFAASFTLNDYFPLPEKEEAEIKKSTSNLSKRPFAKIIKNVSDSVFRADKFKDGSLSATEIFLYKITKHIVNSRGVDVKAVSNKGNIETIPNWVRKDEEVELYNMITFETFDPKEITKKVKEALLLCKSRSKAKQIKAKRLPKDLKIIIEDEEVEQVFSWFAYDLSYANKYHHMNLSEVGSPVQGEEVTGDKINLKVVPFYPGAIGSCFVDDDGVVLNEVSLIEDGVAKTNHGSYQFGYYLGIEKPTGVLPVVVVKEGEMPVEEMKKEPYLRCVKFSGMQLEPTLGFIGGEVRLGFYFDGQKEIPVTGFSISGDFNSVKKSMRFSKETVTLPEYHGPKYLLLQGMEVL